MKVLLILAMFVSVSIAQAQGSQQRVDPELQNILEHSVVTTVLQLLNEKYNGLCGFIPGGDGTQLNWMCMGALPAGQPAPNYASCGFRLQVSCPGERVAIFGNRTTYFSKDRKQIERVVYSVDNIRLEK